MNYWVMPQINRIRTVEQMLEEICLDLEVPIEKIKSKSRLRELADKRAIVCYLFYRVLRLNSVATGKLVNRNHATAIVSCYKVEGLLKYPEFQFVNELINKYKLIKLEDGEERQDF